ncbi:MAG: YtxH domain-containing protein [Bacteroidales bacterium]|nr:YtxH domain-containing protein [Bacteroidales bacterium]
MKCNTFFAFLGGLIVGAGAALLFAPESGSETRKKIKNTFEKEYQNLKEKINNMNNEVDNMASANEIPNDDFSE